VILWAEGPDRAAAYRAAADRFSGLLEELVGELPLLRSPLQQPLTGETARRMARAVAPHRAGFITPMAAVAGAVADTLLGAMRAGTALSRAYVNNGGDIALVVHEGNFRIGICDDPGIGQIGGRVEIRPGDGIGGVATSGWRGRSFSLGIADAVTVLAPTAAEADAAATMIANRIDLPGSAKITRRPARDLSPDSDLGDRFVTVEVGALDASEIEEALASGRDAAKDYHARGLFRAAYLALGTSRITVPDEERPQIGKE
jgi:uncharacterized protein